MKMKRSWKNIGRTAALLMTIQLPLHIRSNEYPHQSDKYEYRNLQITHDIVDLIHTHNDENIFNNQNKRWNENQRQLLQHQLPTRTVTTIRDSASVDASLFYIKYNLLEPDSTVSANDIQVVSDITCTYIQQYMIEIFDFIPLIAIEDITCSSIPMTTTLLPSNAITYSINTHFGDSPYKLSHRDIDEYISVALTAPKETDLIIALRDLPRKNPFSMTTTVSYETSVAQVSATLESTILDTIPTFQLPITPISVINSSNQPTSTFTNAPSTQFLSLSTIQGSNAPTSIFTTSVPSTHFLSLTASQGTPKSKGKGKGMVSGMGMMTTKCPNPTIQNTPTSVPSTLQPTCGKGKGKSNIGMSKSKSKISKTPSPISCPPTKNSEAPVPIIVTPAVPVPVPVPVPIITTPTSVPVPAAIQTTMPIPISVPLSLPTAPASFPLLVPIPITIQTDVPVPGISPVTIPTAAPIPITLPLSLPVPVLIPIIVPTAVPVPVPGIAPTTVPVPIPIVPPNAIPTIVPVGLPVVAPIPIASTVPIPLPVGPPVAGINVSATPFNVVYTPVPTPVTAMDFLPVIDLTCSNVEDSLRASISLNPFIDLIDITCASVSTSSTAPISIQYQVTLIFDPTTTAILTTFDIDTFIDVSFLSPQVFNLLDNLNALPSTNPFSSTTSVTSTI